MNKRDIILAATIGRSADCELNVICLLSMGVFQFTPNALHICAFHIVRSLRMRHTAHSVTYNIIVIIIMFV